MSDNKEWKEIGIRLAIRREGSVVNAYLAQQDTMEGAHWIGSILTGAASNAEIFEAWKAVMTSVMSYAIENIFGEAPRVKERPAPESERGGTA